MAKLHIGLDLGSDTLKIAFAYNDGKSLRYGKIAEESEFSQIAIPAVAFFNESKGKWFYGNQITQNEDSFATIVKIKSLISLLSFKKDKAVAESNKNYYFNKNKFPKFYFPIKRKMLDDFAQMDKAGRTFEGNTTPHEVCRGFFAYVKKVLDKKAKSLNKVIGEVLDGYEIALVHPSSVGESFIEELSAIIKEIFSVAPHKILSSNKALVINAMYRDKLKNDTEFLVFDMGEEDISVVKACIYKKEALIEGVEGHSAPCEIGGIDIDEALIANLYAQVRGRETIGTAAFGQEGHVYEEAIYSKQYLLMKDIKEAKIIFSKELSDDSVFANGVPITLDCDVRVQRVITKEDIRKWIGVDDDNGIARKIADYITEEIARPINKNVKMVYLSGGLTETYSLLEYICEKVKKLDSTIKVKTFDDFNYECKNGYDILSFEDSVFAPSVGGAMVSLNNINIKMITSLSYGTWVYKNGLLPKVLDLFIERGKEIPKEGLEALTKDDISSDPKGKRCIENEELFSIRLTQKEITDLQFDATTCKLLSVTNNLIVGEPNSRERQLVMDKTGLCVVSGGTKGKVMYMHQGVNVEVYGKITFREGVYIDHYGRAVPMYKNTSKDTLWVRNPYSGSGYYVPGKEIKLVTEGVSGWEIEE